MKQNKWILIKVQDLEEMERFLAELVALIQESIGFEESDCEDVDFLQFLDSNGVYNLG
jgi:hypothetical protein